MNISVVLRSLLSLAAISGSYWLYALCAVPLIEPTFHQEKVASAANPTSEQEPVIDRYRHLLEPLFSADSWERKKPLMVRNDDYMLLFHFEAPADETSEDRRKLKLKPCTLIFNPNGLHPRAKDDLGGKVNPSSVVVMRAEDGAVLEFDRPFDLSSSWVMGKIEKGQLEGRVHIYNPLTRQDPKRRLDVVTRDIQIQKDRITTAAKVEFEIGPASGSGRDLVFHLWTENHEQLRRLPESNNLPLRAVELSHLDQLRFQLPDAWLGQNSNPAQPNADRPTFIDLKCDGKMSFDIPAGEVTVEDNVILTRPRSDGEDDHVYCEHLSVHFDMPHSSSSDAVPSVEAGAKNPAVGLGRMFDIRLNRIEVMGSPAVVSVSARSVSEQGVSKPLSPTHEEAIPIQTGMRGRHHAEAVRFEYMFDDDGGLGSFRAHGPGKYRGTVDQAGDGYFEIAWDDQLSLLPDEELYRLSIINKARVVSDQFGRLTADVLHLWMRGFRGDRRAGVADKPVVIQPDRAKATGDVVLESDPLSGNTDQLEVWFKYASDRPRSEAGPAGELALIGADGTTGPSPAGARQPGLRVQGDLIRMLVDHSQSSMMLKDVTIGGRVQCVETNVSAIDKQPFLITGDLLHLQDFTTAGGTAKIEGRPARIQARGVSLAGVAIEMDRSANRIWMDGSGQAMLPLPESLAARYSRRETSAKVTWQGGFDFDGRQVRCHQQVSVEGPAQSIKTDALLLKLTHSIELSDPQARFDDVGVAEIDAQGDVFLENHSFDDRGLVTVDKMFLRDLSINQLTGAVTGNGPGWMESVQEGGHQLLPQAGPSAVDQNKVTKLRVDFQQGVRGNLDRRQLTFFDQVKAIHGSADDWPALEGNPSRQSIPEGSVVMYCQQLHVAQMAGQAVVDATVAADAPDELNTPVELIAEGNTIVYGRTFSARAHRISYAQAKGLLIIEGDGRTDAELRHQESDSGPMVVTKFRKMKYWPVTGRVQVEDSRQIELNF